MSSEIVPAKGAKVATIEPLSFEQFSAMSENERQYTLYVETVAMHNKMIDLENQAGALADPEKLMGLATQFLGGGF